MHDFQLNFLDHVAIRVQDPELSAAWYKRVLGLDKYILPEWGQFPIMMLSGKCGVAIFPADKTQPGVNQTSRSIKIDHFAFNVTKEHFAQARQKFESLKLGFDFQDHHYFQSIYLKDPDGHTVELTTLVVPEENFYKN